jgi:hypothetical protein
MKTDHEIEQRLKEIHEQAEALYVEAEKLRAEKANLRVLELKKKGILAQISWAYVSHWEDQFILESSAKKLIGEVALTMEFDYHSSADLAPGVILRIDDGDLTLRLKKTGLSDFVKEWGIKIDPIGIAQDISKYERQIEELREVTKALASPSDG